MGKKRKRTAPRAQRARAVSAPEITQAAASTRPNARQGTRAALRFLLVAVALMSLLYGAYYFPYDADSWPGRALDTLLAAQGHAAAWLIGLFETGVSAEHGNIHGRFPMRVVKACSSLDAQALFAGTVLAFPTDLRAKLVGLASGTTALTCLNIVRIAALYFVGLHAPRAFDAVHEEIMPLVLIATACLAFAGWAAWARNHRLTGSPA